MDDSSKDEKGKKVLNLNDMKKKIKENYIEDFAEGLYDARQRNGLVRAAKELLKNVRELIIENIDEDDYEDDG